MFKKLITSLKEVLFPRNYTCDVCGRETFNSNLCADCLKQITFNNRATCPICGRMTVKEEICMECKEKLPSFKKAVSPLVYEGASIVLISKFKNGSAYLKEYFADLICEKLKNLPKADGIVYVPMTKKSKRKRGYNQVKLLAEAVSKRTDIPVLKDAVLKVKETAAQKGLTQKEREGNLQGCFKVADKSLVNGKTLLCIDDVLTTGSTAEEMCKTLLKAGATCVYFTTVASVEDKAQKHMREESEKRNKTGNFDKDDKNAAEG